MIQQELHDEDRHRWSIPNGDDALVNEEELIRFAIDVDEEHLICLTIKASLRVSVSCSRDATAIDLAKKWGKPKVINPVDDTMG